MPLSLVVARMSAHRIVQTIRARNSVTVSPVLARCGLLLVKRGEVRREARALSSFAAYIAALDQEQTAAAVYAESISELERWLPGSDPDRGRERRAASG